MGGKMGGFGFLNDKFTDVQDYYNICISMCYLAKKKDEVTIDEKIKKVKEHIRKAIGRTENRLVLNHLSGHPGSNIYTSVTNVAQYVNAPFEYFIWENYINPFNIQEKFEPKHIGVAIMDFPGEQLIARILQTNFYS